MKGMMMHQPLLVSEILEFGAGAYPRAEIVSVRTEGDVHRETFVEFRKRTIQLAHGLKAHGVELGDRIATLAWNGYRHMELYYAISGMGAICHTINPRLSAEQFIYIVNHAEDKILFLDTTFVPIIEAVKDHLPKDLVYVIMTDRAHMPETSFDALCYEELLEGQPEEIEWPVFPEDTACGLCYTSGTTGHPKGALYSHRSTVLHAMMISVMQSTTFNEGASVLPVVPLFHVNAWGLPYSSLLSGLNMVMPGPAMDGPSLFKLMDEEKVFSAWGVPTIWQGLLGAAKQSGTDLSSLERTVVGGSACPPSMITTFREDYGVETIHAWGMTEMSPVGSVNKPLAKHGDLPEAEQHRQRENQGRPVFGVELEIWDDAGNPVPHDGETQGALVTRGHWILDAYYRSDRDSTLRDGWFDTGDIATMDADGYITIRDRAKDIIKSGGEWISSVELENIAIAHPDLADAAVIGAAHPKWDERPVLVAVKAEGADPSEADVLKIFEDQIAKWQVPDRVVFAEALPRNATGKVLKRDLRDQFGDVLMDGTE